MDLATEMMARPDSVVSHETLLSDLMIAVIERFTAWRTFPVSIREMNVSGRDWRIKRVAEAMRADVGNVTSIDKFAKGAGLSRAFFRLFESSIGVPPKVYLNVVRMEQAMDAVLHQDVTVGEISERLGFSEPAHLHASFAITRASVLASFAMFRVSRADVCNASIMK
jgi:transcriptional regulator GlxA family with amidase domain